MAFEPNYEKLVTSYHKALTNTQAKVDVRLSTVDGSEVKSILCSSAKSHIINSELNGNTINYTGEVNFQIIYESALGDIYGLDYTAEFTDKYVNDMVEKIQVPIVESNVVDVEIDVLNPTTISASAIVETNIGGVTSENTQALTGVVGDNVFTSMETGTYYNYLGMLQEKYDLTQDVEIDNSISKVLSVTPSVTLESVTPKTDFAVVAGNVFVDMCYLTNEEIPCVRSYTTSFDFNMEVALSGLQENDYILNNVYVNSTNIKVTTNIEQDKAIVNLVLPIVYSGYAFHGNTLDMVVDLYSTTNELNVVSNSVMSIVPSATLTNIEKINGSVLVENSFVDEILGNCCNYVSITSTFVEEDAVVVEGVASTTVLYFNKEESSKNSIIVEMPFSVRIKADGINDTYTPIVNCVMSDVGLKSKRGQEIEVFAKLYFYIDVFGVNTSAVISEVSVGEEKMPSNCAIRIYIVKENETLWDVAKELGTSVEELMAQNPELELPLKAGDRVYMYYQKVMEF